MRTFTATAIFMTIALFPFTQVLAATPLTDMGSSTYLGFEGGLYEDGTNVMPADHAAAGMKRATLVQPRDRSGQIDARGTIVMLSIGMSNTTQEFCAAANPAPCDSWTFTGQAQTDPAVNHSTLEIVNGARGGQVSSSWDSPTDPNYDRVRDVNLAAVQATEAQVQVAWIKVANAQPSISLPSASADAFTLVTQIGQIVRAMKVRYPNLQLAYVSSRIYAGYATTALNPEPYAYESGFAVKWVVQAQVDQWRSNGMLVDPRAGDLSDSVAPWIAWGPYLWADGLNPRSDGLIWVRSDLQSDGTHPSQSGEQKVGTMLLNFFKSEPSASGWFLERPGIRRRGVRRGF